MERYSEVVGRISLAHISVLARVSPLKVAENATRVILNKETEWKVIISQPINYILHFENKNRSGGGGSSSSSSKFSSKESIMIHESLTYIRIFLCHCYYEMNATI